VNHEKTTDFCCVVKHTAICVFGGRHRSRRAHYETIIKTLTYDIRVHAATNRQAAQLHKTGGSDGLIHQRQRYSCADLLDSSPCLCSCGPCLSV